MRLLVTGGRNYPNYWTVHEILDGFHKTTPIACLIEGGALGVDRFARRWAEINGVPVETYAVDHALDGPWPGAGPRRNRRMLRESRPDRVLAFPGGSGTASMIGIAERDGVPVTVIEA